MRTVRVTLTYVDTLTRGGEGGRVVICVLYAYCQSYSDLRGYSDKGKGRWYSVYCTRTVRVQRYSDKGGGGGEGGNPRTVRVLSELLWSPWWTADLTWHYWGGEGGNPRTVRVLSELLWSPWWTADLTWHYWTWMLNDYRE